MLNSKVSIKLDKQLSCEYICANVQKLVNSYLEQYNDLSNFLLVCELKEITTTNQTLLPRIGLKNEQTL